MISLTDDAARKITQTIQRRGHGIGIRVGVRTTGCSGLAYVLEYVDTAQPEDICIDCANCKLFVDPKSCAYLQGLEVDYTLNYCIVSRSYKHSRYSGRHYSKTRF